MPIFKPIEPNKPDHYFNLGLGISATAAEIKTAFRRLALLHHPDKKAPGESADATEFRRIHEAYDVLKDATTRQAYDPWYPQLRRQWINYRYAYTEHLRQAEGERETAEAERRRREQERGDLIRKACERVRAETEANLQQRERTEKERLAEERSRIAIQRAQQEREQAAIALLRQLVEAEERARLAKEQLERTVRDKREKEAEARSAAVLEKARIGQQNRALAQLQQDAAELKAREEAETAKKESRYRRLFEEQQQAEALAAKQASDAALHAQIARSERIKIAKLWASEKHARYAEAHPTPASQLLDGEYIKLGWDEKHGTAICDFCDERVRFYYYQCPLGEAVACGNCVNRMSFYSRCVEDVKTEDGGWEMFGARGRRRE
jgi:curved DNA-binding protein CbpA